MKALSFFRNYRHWFIVARRVGVEIPVLKDLVLETAIEAVGRRAILDYVDFGGSNNQGFFTVRRPGTFSPTAVCKIQRHALAEREYRFMRWAVSSSSLKLASDVFSMRRITGTDYAMVCCQYLKKPDPCETAAVFLLHQRMAAVHDLSGLVLTGNRNLREEIVPDTPIKSMLFHVVSNPDAEAVRDYLLVFLDKKRLCMPSDVHDAMQALIEDGCLHWPRFWKNESIGLVHGDFKKGNILVDPDGGYRLIDLQYYLEGHRVWDVAFFFSKMKNFDAVVEGCKRVDTDDRHVFWLFYLLSVMIGLSEDNGDELITTRIRPGLAALSAV